MPKLWLKWPLGSFTSRPATGSSQAVQTHKFSRWNLVILVNILSPLYAVTQTCWVFCRTSLPILPLFCPPTFSTHSFCILLSAGPLTKKQDESTMNRPRDEGIFNWKLSLSFSPPPCSIFQTPRGRLCLYLCVNHLRLITHSKQITLLLCTLCENPASGQNSHPSYLKAKTTPMKKHQMKSIFAALSFLCMFCHDETSG